MGLLGAMSRPLRALLSQASALARGVELITNGTFATDTSGWTLQTSTLSWVAGVLRVTNAGAAFGKAYQAITTVVGRSYEVTADFTLGTATSGFLTVGTTAGGSTLGAAPRTTSGPMRLVFTATGTTSYVNVSNSNQSNAYGDFDNVSVRELV